MLNTRPLFLPGQVVATVGAVDAGVSLEVAAELVTRHTRGDWGVIGAVDAAANQAAVRDGDRIFSAYDVELGGQTVRVNVVTEADRKLTTILLPSDN